MKTIKKLKKESYQTYIKTGLLIIEVAVSSVIELRLKFDHLSDEELLDLFKNSEPPRGIVHEAPEIRFKDNKEVLSLEEILKITSNEYFPLEMDRLIEAEDLEKLSEYFAEKGFSKKLSRYGDDDGMFGLTSFWSTKELIEKMKKAMIKEKNKMFTYLTDIFISPPVYYSGTWAQKGDINTIRALYWFQKNNKGDSLTFVTNALLIKAKYFFFIRNFKKYRFLENEELLDKVLIEFDRGYTLRELKKEKEYFKFYKYQIERVEELLASKRMYSVKNWNYIYNSDNILMKEIASTLLWGTYKDNQLDKVFMFQNESFIDITGAKTSLLENESITLVHPIELNEKDLKEWNNIFKKNKIKQVSPQLNREFYIPDDDDLISMTSGSFISKKLENNLKKNSWTKYLSTGYFEGYYKEFNNCNTGFKIGYEKGCFDGDEKVSGIVRNEFYQKDKDAEILKIMFPPKRYSESKTYIQNVRDAKVISDNSTIDKRFYSEIIRDIIKITKASSQ